MRVLPVNPAEPREDRLRDAHDVLVAGDVVALPTETFYGLATDSLNPKAVEQLNALKGKAGDSPVLLLLANRDQAGRVARDLPTVFHRLGQAFWPGPLTLVVPAVSDLPRAVTGGRDTVAVRVPGLRLPRALALALGRPITGVSANRYREPPARTASEVAGAFPEGVALILDGGPTAGGAASTIIDLTAATPRVLREGLLPWTSVARIVPDLVPPD